MPTSSYGNWQSPLSAKQVIATANTPVDLTIDQGQLYWLELRPNENSRLTLLTLQDNKPLELTPAPINVRSRVHEYGGNGYLILENQLYFCDGEDQRIYRLDLLSNTSPPQPITPPGPFRYADLQLDPRRNCLLCVRESHPTTPKTAYPHNEIIAIDLNTGQQHSLVSGADFYASLQLSPDGKRLCWLNWNHPHMPWDAAELHYGELDAQGLLNDPQHLAGSPNESIFQPSWENDTHLIFASDRSGWWNLYRQKAFPQKTPAECLHSATMEFGRAQWVSGQRTYCLTQAPKVQPPKAQPSKAPRPQVLPAKNILCGYLHQGHWRLGEISEQGFKAFGPPYSDIKSVTADEEHAWFIASYPNRPDNIVRLNLTSLKTSPLFKPVPHSYSEYFSIPQSIHFNNRNQEQIQGFLYLPHHKDHPPTPSPPPSLPPLIIKTHGGPSAYTSSRLDLNIQFWTSRGFALFDINYRGSTGFGRTYREKLYGQWGVVDVEDCIDAAQYLVAQHLVHPQQQIIRGHSAGGYTALCALMFHRQFNAGASLYGISDLKKLAAECHKFESHYVAKLIGSEEEFPQRYRERSPLNADQKTACPIIFLQGLKDKVVPPNQSQLMANKLKKEGMPVAYIEFPEEGHGFRRSDNQIAALEAELYFYRRILNLADTENLPEIDIVNLP